MWQLQEWVLGVPECLYDMRGKLHAGLYGVEGWEAGDAACVCKHDELSHARHHLLDQYGTAPAGWIIIIIMFFLMQWLLAKNCNMFTKENYKTRLPIPYFTVFFYFIQNRARWIPTLHLKIFIKDRKQCRHITRTHYISSQTEKQHNTLRRLT